MRNVFIRISFCPAENIAINAHFTGYTNLKGEQDDSGKINGKVYVEAIYKDGTQIATMTRRNEDGESESLNDIVLNWFGSELFWKSVELNSDYIKNAEIGQYNEDYEIYFFGSVEGKGKKTGRGKIIVKEQSCFFEDCSHRDVMKFTDEIFKTKPYEMKLVDFCKTAQKAIMEVL